MKNIVASAIALMLFATVAGTIQAFYANKNGVFDKLYQPQGIKAVNKDVVKNPLHKGVAADPTPIMAKERVSSKNSISKKVTPDTHAVKENIIMPKPIRKIKSSMFSRGALDEEYIMEEKAVETDSSFTKL